MRTHGWSGYAPATEEEAIDRILDASAKAIDEHGPDLSLSDVARDLGVTRQTVYRYFPSTEALLMATAIRAADGFLGRLEAHLRGETDPATAVVEGMAYAIEMLADDAQVGVLLNRGSDGAYTAAVTSDTALAFGRMMLERLDVDWAAHGFDGDQLDELSEFTLRAVQSFIVDPGRPVRTGIRLRRYLFKWIYPAIVAVQTSEMSAK